MPQKVGNSGAAKAAVVLASLINPNTGATAGEVLETESTNTNPVTGDWSLDLLTQDEALSTYGASGTYWQIVEPVSGSAVPKTWNVLVASPDPGPNSRETLVSALTSATSVPVTTPQGPSTGAYGDVPVSSLKELCYG